MAYKEVATYKGTPIEELVITGKWRVFDVPNRVWRSSYRLLGKQFTSLEAYQHYKEVINDLEYLYKYTRGSVHIDPSRANSLGSYENIIEKEVEIEIKIIEYRGVFRQAAEKTMWISSTDIKIREVWENEYEEFECEK